MTKLYQLCAISVFLGAWWLGSAQAEPTGGVLGQYVVKSVEFNFVGKRSFKDKRLAKLLTFKKGDTIDTVLAGFGRDDVEDFYLKKGYAFVKVRLFTPMVSSGKVIYTIEEGPKVKIKSVKFSGNKTFKPKVLRKATKSDGKSWLVMAKKYSEERVGEDTGGLEDFYQEQGFLDRQINATTSFSVDNKKAWIEFEIKEGPVYNVNSITVSGDDKLYVIGDEVLTDEKALVESLSVQAGEVYRKKRIDRDAAKIQGLFREHGFIDATVTLHVDRIIDASPIPAELKTEGRVNLEYVVSAGEQFRIGKIDITGNKETQDKVIRRILDSYEFAPGENYNANVARGDGTGNLEKELRMGALMAEATVTPVASETSGQKNAEVLVKESRTGAWILGAGVSSDSGLIGSMMWEQRNFDVNNPPRSVGDFVTGEAFKGGGQRLRLSLNPGTEVSQYSVDFTEPYYQNKPLSLNLVGLSWERGRESYDEERTKGYVGLSQNYEWRTRDKWRKNAGFRAENVGVGRIDFDAPKEIKDEEGDNMLFGLKLGLGKNYTDNKFDPKDGYRIETSYEQVAGDYTFGILSATLRRYTPIYEDLTERKTILATKVHAATTVGDAPTFEKFYAGGSGPTYGIRGFEYRGVSTRGVPEVNGLPLTGADKDDPIGSDWIFLASAEVIVPMVEESLSAVFFVDSGTVDTGSYRVSIGSGIQLMIPQWFGPVPMRFELALPLLKEDEDETQPFSFSVAQLF